MNPSQHCYPVASLRADIISEAYEDLRLMVFNIAHRFSAKFKIPFEDMLGQAHVIFIQQMDRYDPAHGAKLGTWIFSKVTWGLMSWMRTELRHWHLDDADELDEEASNADSRFLVEIVSELSDDARAVVQLILDAENDFKLTCRWNRAHTRSGMLRSLREHLEDIGWHSRQIKTCIQEIRHVLCDGAENEPEREKEDETPRPLARLNLRREDVWLSARVGLTPREVRALVCA